MAQLVARIDDDIVEQLDALVAAGEVASRSEAVRRSLVTLIDTHRRRRVASAIVEGYRLCPQSEDEVGWADAATAAMIAEEPW